MALNDLLSQDEIDALLHGVAFDLEGEGSERIEEGGVRHYDFASEDRIFRGRMPALESVNRRFSSGFRASLMDMFSPAAEVSGGDVEMMKFGEYIHTLFIPTSLNTVRAQTLRGSALIVFDPALVSCAVETYFGGDGRYPARIEGRDFSPMEQRVTGMLLDRALGDLRKAWAPVLEAEFERVGSEADPDSAGVVDPTEVVVTSKFQVELAGGVGELHVVFPYGMLEPVRERLDDGPPGDAGEIDARWRAALGAGVRGAEVEVSGLLAETEVSLRDVLAMRPGDVIPIPAAPTVRLLGEGEPLFRGRLGEANEHFAIEISERLNRPGSKGNVR